MTHCVAHAAEARAGELLCGGCEERGVHATPITVISIRSLAAASTRPTATDFVTPDATSPGHLPGGSGYPASVDDGLDLSW
ncbi:hypothetical protein [Frankia sp. CiP3]|uniref:hypothetical protein n=1 Tax=Frankia sp. CiP3 TaxID=2880971 RepID=UPI001EF64C2E|nr:hypothetical protein [Frankia sp. CiP3]